MLVSAHIAARSAQREALETELETYDAENDLPLRERAYYYNLGAQLAHSVETLTKLVNERRQDVVERRHAEVERQAREAPKDLLAEANRNLVNSSEVRNRTKQLADATNQIAQLKNELMQWQQRIQRTKRRVEKGTRDSAVMSLRKDRGAAGERLAQLRRELSLRTQQALEIQFQLVNYQDSGDEYADIEAQVAKLRKQKGFDTSPDEEQSLIDATRKILTTYKELLDDLTSRTAQYFELLIDWNDVTQDFINELTEYSAYVDERILWMRSADPITRRTAADAWAALKELGHPQQWRGLITETWLDFIHHPLLTGIFLTAMTILVGYRVPLRRKLTELGETASRGNCIQYLPTLEAVAVTVLISGTWSLLLMYLGWRLVEISLSARSRVDMFWGAALLGAAGIYFPLETLRQVCRRKGLGECHFNWSTRVLVLLRLHLRWFVLAATLLMMVCYGMQSHHNDAWNTSLGRLSYVLMMLLTTTFVQRMIRPQGGVFHDYLAFHGEGWVGRLKWLWYPAIVLTPAATAFLAAVGYYYTARQLSVRIYSTAVVVFVAVILGSILNRILLIGRRKLAMRQARERQQRLQEQADAEEAGRQVPVVESSMDLAAMNLQTRRLIYSSLILASFVGIWIIWSDMLPALAVLENVTLYRTDGIQPGAIEPVTLADLGLALIVLVMTWIAARNLPGVVEIVLLQRLPLESAVRYAITTLARYLIAIFGVIVISSMLGFSWRRAQWLVAALGVGLGFGLQEIFANFVSGLILLFERPIRVGDIITLGDVSGVVKRIRIRATTVRDWDGKELIVPNKDLITGRLLNWTLSDTENRVVIPVGIAYGANVRRARDLIPDIATHHPEVSKQPPPTVTFEGFDASSLRLVLRAFLPKFETRTDFVHDLHMAIHDRFQREGIDIAFPQLDVHLRDCTALTVQRSLPSLREGTLRAG